MEKELCISSLSECDQKIEQKTQLKSELTSAEESLVFHIKEIQDTPMDYKCDACGKSFVCQAYLRKHIKTVHDGRKNHKCETCG